MTETRELTHSCEVELEKAIKGNALLSSLRANDGDLWQCSCGKVYIHTCDEAEGCDWQETENHNVE
jgi:hypothetical protein